MTTKELIRKEVERLQDVHADAALEWKTEEEAYAYSSCAVEFGNDLLSFLDTLPDEPEQPPMGYDEAYLNKKIAKASKSWKGVDVDKFMDEIRGREPMTDCHDLTEAKEGYLRKARSTPGHEWMTRDIEDAFKAGAEWQKQKMMEGAVEGFVGVYLHDKRADVTVNSGYLPKEMGIKGDSKVKIIIVKEEEQ